MPVAQLDRASVFVNSGVGGSSPSGRIHKCLINNGLRRQFDNAYPFLIPRDLRIPLAPTRSVWLETERQNRLREPWFPVSRKLPLVLAFW